MNIVVNFLKELPGRAGAQDARTYYRTIIDADHNQVLTYQEISDAIQFDKSHQGNLARWFNNPKERKLKRTYLARLERVLGQDFTKEIKISELLAQPTMKTSAKTPDSFEPTRRLMTETMKNQGYEIIPGEHLKFRLVETKYGGYSNYKVVQLRDPSESQEYQPVPCLIPEVSTSDNCYFFALLDRAISKSDH